MPGGADDIDGQVDEDMTEVTSHQLVAADRYDVERLTEREQRSCDRRDAVLSPSRGQRTPEKHGRRAPAAVPCSGRVHARLRRPTHRARTLRP